ncbi:MAG: hypothetical protein ABIH21_04605, partial [Patescibacteria group bacterium]
MTISALSLEEGNIDSVVENYQLFDYEDATVLFSGTKYVPNDLLFTDLSFEVADGETKTFVVKGDATNNNDWYRLDIKHMSLSAGRWTARTIEGTTLQFPEAPVSAEELGEAVVNLSLTSPFGSRDPAEDMSIAKFVVDADNGPVSIKTLNFIEYAEGGNTGSYHLIVSDGNTDTDLGTASRFITSLIFDDLNIEIPDG